MNKHIIVNLLKYALALGLMVWVIGSNWGDPRGTVGKIVVGGEPEKGKITGKVLSYQPKESIRIERFSEEREDTGEAMEFALKPNGKTLIVQNDGATLNPGVIVTLSGISRGLAYIWQRHVHGGEPIHAGYLLLALVLAVCSLMLTFVRWYILVRAVELPFRLIDAFRLGFIGLFFNNFMPGSVGGDVIKAAVLAREQDRRTVAVATVIMDRAIALWALIWFVALLGAVFWMSGLLVGQGAEQCRTIVTIAWTIIGLSMLAWTALGLLPDVRAQALRGTAGALAKGRRRCRRVVAGGVDVSLPAARRLRRAGSVVGRSRRLRLLLLLCRAVAVAAGLRRADSHANPALPDRADRPGDSGGAVLSRRGRHRRVGLRAAL